MRTLTYTDTRQMCRDHKRISIFFALIIFALFLPTLGHAQCDLVITDPASICEPATIDLTDPAITAGSSSGLTITYWSDSVATIALSNPTSVTTSGTYYIGAQAADGCFVIMPVNVRVDPEIIPTFDPIGPINQNETEPPLSPTSLNGITGIWDPTAINTAIAGTSSFTFTPDPGQCSISLTMDITIVATTSIEQEAYKTVFELYPNPNSGIFNIKYQSSHQCPIELSVSDITGRVIYSRIYTNAGHPMSEMIQLSESLPGVYIVRMISDTEVSYKKVIVQ